HPAHLVDDAAVRGAPAPPLRPVHRTELALGVRPFVPDRDAVLVQIADVRLAAQKPQELVDDGLEMQLLGGQEREARREIAAQLVAEDALRAGAGPVRLAYALLAHLAQEIEVRLHRGGAGALRALCAT